MMPPHLDAESLSRSLFASNERIMELEAEIEKLRGALTDVLAAYRMSSIRSRAAEQMADIAQAALGDMGSQGVAK